MSLSLDKILQQAHSEGRLDSEGAFTISLDRALEKMARHTLERPSAWILKAVQAAVGLGASVLNGRVTRGWTSLEIRFEQGGPSWNQVRNAVSQPELENLPALEDLAAGLWSLARGAQRSFRLHATVHKSEFDRRYPSLRWNDKKFTVNDQGAGDALCSELQVIINRPAASILSRVARLFGGGSYFLDELDELRYLAYLLPLESRIDGISGHHFLRAQTAVKDISRGLSFQNPPDPFLWGWAPSKDMPELGLHPRWEEFANHIQRDVQQRLALDLWGSHPSAMWALSFDFKTLGQRRARERSEIRWVHHGVVVDQTPIPVPEEATMGVVLHLSARDLPTDLGGLRLVAGEAFGARRNAGLHLLKQCLAPEELQYKICNWDLSEQAVKACLQHAELLASNLP